MIFCPNVYVSHKFLYDTRVKENYVDFLYSFLFHKNHFKLFSLNLLVDKSAIIYFGCLVSNFVSAVAAFFKLLFLTPCFVDPWQCRNHVFEIGVGAWYHLVKTFVVENFLQAKLFVGENFITLPKCCHFFPTKLSPTLRE